MTIQPDRAAFRSPHGGRDLPLRHESRVADSKTRATFTKFTQGPASLLGDGLEPLAIPVLATSVGHQRVVAGEFGGGATQPVERLAVAGERLDQFAPMIEFAKRLDRSGSSRQVRLE